MARIVGILLLVVGVWVGAEVMTKGVGGAFGGVFASFAGAAPEEEHRWAGERAGSAVDRAHALQEERRARMLEP